MIPAGYTVRPPIPSDILGQAEQVMKILALIGSPRKGGNTDILVEQILKGLKRGGHSGEKLYLYDYEILPCLDCRGCKGGDVFAP